MSLDDKALTADEILGWLEDRRQNCVRLSRQKTGADKDGWLEDEKYLASAISLIRSSALPQGSAPEGMVALAGELLDEIEALHEFAETNDTSRLLAKGRAMIAAAPSDPVVKVQVIGKSEG